ncbi:hypothetical protein ACRAWF_14525 [Streptomyces sp. L7]
MSWSRALHRARGLCRPAARRDRRAARPGDAQARKGDRPPSPVGKVSTTRTSRAGTASRQEGRAGAVDEVEPDASDDSGRPAYLSTTSASRRSRGRRGRGPRHRPPPRGRPQRRSAPRPRVPLADLVPHGTHHVTARAVRRRRHRVRAGKPVSTADITASAVQASAPDGSKTPGSASTRGPE